MSKPDERLSKSERDQVTGWINENAKRYWLLPGGPLRPPSEGGADIVVVDDPQMIGLIKISKEIAPDRPVIFRSHIHIRSDLIRQHGSPQAEVWEWLWESVRLADIFISHPMSYFVPPDVDRERVGYMPASTDWYVTFPMDTPYTGLTSQVGWTEQKHAGLGLCLLRPVIQRVVSRHGHALNQLSRRYALFSNLIWKAANLYKMNTSYKSRASTPRKAY